MNIITTNDLQDFEKRYIENMLLTLKVLRPALYDKLFYTGEIAIRLSTLFDIENKKDFCIAAYLSNIGLMSVINVLEKEDFLHDKEFELVRRHPTLSAEILKKQGYEQASKYALSHHETPNGKGYFKEIKSPLESYLINIADTFQGCIAPKGYKPPLTLNEALKVTLANFTNSPIFSQEKIKNIETILESFYNEYF